VNIKNKITIDRIEFIISKDHTESHGGPLKNFLSLRIFLTLSTLSTLLCTPQFAQATGLDFGIHHEYESPRALGMGDAFVALSDDYSGLFYNPAALARREDGDMNWYIDFRLTKDIFTLSKDITDASSTKTSGTQDQQDAAQQQAVANVLQNVYGSQYYGRFSFPNAIWVRPNWGMAIIPLDLTLQTTVHQQVGPSLDTKIYSDTIMAFGMGKDYGWIPNGRTSAGFNLKAVYRGFFNESIDAPSIATNPNLIQPSQFREGSTVDLDFGLMYDPEIPETGFLSAFKLAKPTFAFVLRNALDYGFKEGTLYNKDENTEPPEKLYRRIDIGSKWEYPSLWIFSGRGVLDFRDLLHPNVSLKKSTHIGLEADWKLFSWWKGAYRVGLNQGYATAGVSALFAIFNLDVLTYGEDIGTSTESKENRKYEVRMSLNW
jgi:hypothetical protein